MSHDWGNALHITPIKNSPGFFEARLCKGGPMVPARMWIMRGKYYAEIDGRMTDPERPEAWPWKSVPEDKFREMTIKAQIARSHYPDSPEANPYRPITESNRSLS